MLHSCHMKQKLMIRHERLSFHCASCFLHSDFFLVTFLDGMKYFITLVQLLLFNPVWKINSSLGRNGSVGVGVSVSRRWVAGSDFAQGINVHEPPSSPLIIFLINKSIPPASGFCRIPLRRKMKLHTVVIISCIREETKITNNEYLWAIQWSEWSVPNDVPL